MPTAAPARRPVHAVVFDIFGTLAPWDREALNAFTRAVSSRAGAN